jgi:hypothetical protein
MLPWERDVFIEQLKADVEKEKTKNKTWKS